MNVNELIKKFGSMVNEELTDKEIWNAASQGQTFILSDPRVSTLVDVDSQSPLHLLAKRRVKDILNHPDISMLRDEYGKTPLHYLAHQGVKEVWFHPDFNRVKDEGGRTPKDWWFIPPNRKPLTCTDFIKN